MPLHDAGHSLLQMAVEGRHNDPQVLQALVQEGRCRFDTSDPRVVSSIGQEFVCMAGRGETRFISLLLQAGLPANIREAMQSSAAALGAEAAAAEADGSGPPAEQRRCALEAAIDANQLHAAQALVAAGAMLPASRSKQASGELARRIQQKHLAWVEVLLSAGAQVTLEFRGRLAELALVPTRVMHQEVMKVRGGGRRML